MSIFTTPLQIGYFMGLLFALIFWYRGFKEERHSDLFLGFVVFFLAMTLQDYTFGFSGINYLWEEMNGFPRYFSLAFAPTVWFYLRAQINRAFRFSGKDWLHYLPYFTYVAISLFVFFSGTKTVYAFQNGQFAIVISTIERLAIWTSYIYYLYQSLKIYKSYRTWAENQFSNQETISFIWLRNFIYVIVLGEIFRWIWYWIDVALDLKFEEDWWWQLLTIMITLYVGIEGYAQQQPNNLTFDPNQTNNESSLPEIGHLITEPIQDEPLKEETSLNNDIDYAPWEGKLLELMTNEKPYLDAELSLTDLAKKLKTNTSILSAVINQCFGKNFNDFVNEYRVTEFERLAKSKDYKNLTILAIAYDCGFNSKATFNRSVKKLRQVSPSELMSKQVD